MIMAEKLLHQVQKKILELLISNVDDPLTIREIQTRIGASSTSVIIHHIQQLEKKGYLKRNPYNPRDYQILRDKPENPVAHLNLYGLAACGSDGSILDGNPVERIAISSKLLPFPIHEAFAVRAKGKSMEPKIYDGDIVIARKTSKVENGKLYICINNGEALIKAVQLDGKNIILQSLNSKFKPFIASEDLRIEGEIKTIISRKI